MARPKGNLVKVRDPKGEIFEVTPPNAHDLVQHLGWTYLKVITEDEREEVEVDHELTRLATAPRAVKTREEQIKERVEKEKAHRRKKADQDDEEPRKVRARKTRKPAAVEEEGPSGDPELDALEREESERSDPAFGTGADFEENADFGDE